MSTEKKQTSILISLRKSRYPLNKDDGRTEIFNYGVASLLKTWRLKPKRILYADEKLVQQLKKALIKKKGSRSTSLGLLNVRIF